MFVSSKPRGSGLTNVYLLCVCNLFDEGLRHASCQVDDVEMSFLFCYEHHFYEGFAAFACVEVLAIESIVELVASFVGFDECLGLFVESLCFRTFVVRDDANAANLS